MKCYTFVTQVLRVYHCINNYVTSIYNDHTLKMVHGVTKVYHFINSYSTRVYIRKQGKKRWFCYTEVGVLRFVTKLRVFLYHYSRLIVCSSRAKRCRPSSILRLCVILGFLIPIAYWLNRLSFMPVILDKALLVNMC